MKRQIKRARRNLLIGVSGALLFSFTPVVNSTVQAETEEGTGFFSEIAENTVFTLDTHLTAFTDDPGYEGADDDTFHLFGRLAMESNANLTESLMLNYDLYVAGSTQSDEYDGVFREPGTEDRNAAVLDFTNLYLSYSSDVFEATIGKKTIETGFAELYSPTNRFGLVNGLRPMDPVSIGVWHAGFDYLIADDSISFKVAPFHEKSLIPLDGSRWQGSSGDGDLISLPAGILPGSVTFEDTFYDESPENWSYLLQYQAVRESYDFFVLLHYGPAVYTVLQGDPTNPTNYFKIDPMAWSFGGGYSRVMEEWKVYLEAIVQLTEDGEDDDFVKYTVGVSYRETEFANRLGLDEITPVIEFNGDETIEDQDAPGFVSSSVDSRPFQNTLSARLGFQYNDDWSSSIGGVYDFSEEDWTFGVGLEHSPTDNMKIKLTATLIDGDPDTQFGRFKDNDNITCSLEYKF